MPEIYPDNFEQKIGFDRIRLQLKDHCLSPLGKEIVDEVRFLTNVDSVRLQLSLTDEFLRIIREFDTFPTSYFFDLRPALSKIKIEGTFLESNDLFDLKRSLDTLKGIISFFRNAKEETFPNLKKLAGKMSEFGSITKEIDQILTKFGVIKDNASPGLHEVRKNISALQFSISKKMQAILRQLQAEGLVEEDANVAIRDGRPVIPVLSANKKKVTGIVHDESATGKTAYVEPAIIVELNNRLRELENLEKREIIKILIEISTFIRPYIEELIDSYFFMGHIDFIRAKALYANQYDCVKPEVRTEPFFDWYNARHPLLVQALRKEKREVVPLNLRLDEPNRILLISGPNAGGKSVCLKTVGIIQYMLQCGMLVPMGEGSRVGIFQSVFIDIGDEQSIDNDLSTYSSHLVNMKFFTRNCSPNSLVLIDEFGTGTEPMLGGAIAEAVLNKLNNLGTFGVITTHYTNLKHFGSSQKGLVNGAMLYDSNGMQPLFKLQIGKPGSSFAFEIARKIGLSKEILDEATEKLGKEHIDYDKHLREIVRDKQYWETKRLKIKDSERKLGTLSEEYQTEFEALKKQRKEILDKAKKEAAKILDEANKTIEKTIKDIIESQADKVKTREIRNIFKETKERITSEDNSQSLLIDLKMEKLKQKEEKKKQQKLPKTANLQNQPVKETKPAKPIFIPGEKVRLKDNGSIGEIIDLDKNKVVLALGSLLSTVSIDRIEPISKNEIKKVEKESRIIPKADSLKRTNEILSKKLSFKPDIDIRGQRADEALMNIQSFIDDAIVLRASTLRILHGKGYGILKDVIRGYLKSEPVVKSFRDEHIQLGGAGITVVELE